MRMPFWVSCLRSSNLSGGRSGSGWNFGLPGLRAVPDFLLGLCGLLMARMVGQIGHGASTRSATSSGVPDAKMENQWIVTAFQKTAYGPQGS